MAVINTRALRLDTTKANEERSTATSEASVSTSVSNMSYASTSRTDSCSDCGPDSSPPEDDYLIKPEHSPPSTPLVSTPANFYKRGKNKVQKDRSLGEESRKAKVNERSKTGCITCRKRKKKCDETRPHCLNCSKTNYNCEGYVSRRDWKPTSRRGSTKSEDDPCSSSLKLPHQPSLPTLPGIEDETDTRLFRHYIEKTSQILSINTTEEENPWTDLILPLAKDDQCLMHFVLALSGAHFKSDPPDRVLQDRQLFHEDAAIKQLRKRLEGGKMEASDAEPLTASMILHFLMSKNGVSNSQPQSCLKAVGESLQPPETDFWRFAWEFYTQYEFSTNLTSLPGLASRPTLEQLQGLQGLNSGSWPCGNKAMRLKFGVLPGLIDVGFMTLISKITILRDQIRDRQIAGETPFVPYQVLATADEIGRNIEVWQSGQTEGTARYVAAELYRKASLLYLLRTVRSTRSPESRSSFGQCVSYGLQCLEILPASDPVQSGLLLPTFILGCGAFERDHRVRVGKALDRIEAYSGFGNVRPIREILERVWEMMASEQDRSWDWESIMHDMGYDTLVA